MADAAQVEDALLAKPVADMKDIAELARMARIQKIQIDD